jgi:hypothetical protein
MLMIATWFDCFMRTRLTAAGLGPLRKIRAA